MIAKRSPVPRLMAVVQRRKRFIAAIGIARVIGLAHPADEIANAAPEAKRGGERKKQKIAPRHERIRQAVRPERDLRIARERRVADPAQNRKIQHMIRAKTRSPAGKGGRDRFPKFRPALEFDAVALPVGKTKRLHCVILLQRPGQADGGILPAGEQDKALSRGFWYATHDNRLNLFEGRRESFKTTTCFIVTMRCYPRLSTEFTHDCHL